MDYAEFEKQITEEVLALYGDVYVAHINDGLIENGIGRGVCLWRNGKDE